MVRFPICQEKPISKLRREVIDELKSIGKPFIVVVNSADVHSPACKAVVDKLKEKYEVPVLAIAVNHMSEEDVHDILRRLCMNSRYRRSISTCRSGLQY